jgi:hypothetical protein
MDLLKQELIKKRLEINTKIKIFTKLLNQHQKNELSKHLFLGLIYDLRKERKQLNYCILNFDYIKNSFHI